MLSLDWLSVVLSDDRQEIIDYLVKRLSEVLVSEFQSAGGVHGYEFSKRSDGVVIAYGGESQKNTLLLSLSGSACSVLGWYGASALVRALLKFSGVTVKFSRVDLALDVVGEWWQYFDHPDRVFERLHDRRIKSVTIVNNYERQDEPLNVMGAENWIISGHTTYIGSRTSERFMRIYKKLKDDGSKVTRFEYELKERYALVVGSMMLHGNTIAEAYIFANTKHIDISDIYDLSVVCDEEPCQSLPRKKVTSRFQWLMSVSSALVDFMNAEPDMWATVLHEGMRKSPVGNTGVHFSEDEMPDWLLDIDCQALNVETFGTVYHPVMAFNFFRD